MKTEKELNALKEEVSALSAKLSELTVEEMELLAGGMEYPGEDYIMNCTFENNKYAYNQTFNPGL